MASVAKWASRAADAVMARHGVTADLFVLLTLLAERDGAMQQDLVGRSGSAPNTVRAMFVLLERHGLVRRRAHAEDGRARNVELTARGRQLQAELWKTSDGLRGRITSAIPAAAAARVDLERALRELALVEGPVAGRAAGGKRRRTGPKAGILAK